MHKKNSPEASLFVYRDLLGDASVKTFYKLIKYIKQEKEKALPLYYDLFHVLNEEQYDRELNGPLWANHIARLIWQDENFYTRIAECGKAESPSLKAWVDADLPVLKALLAFDWEGFVKEAELPALPALTLDINAGSSLLNEGITALQAIFAENEDVEKLHAALSAFYRKYGCGEFSGHLAYQWHNGLVPLAHPAMVHFSDLVGYEYQKSVLRENTRAFIEGRKANHVLLYGEKGTGKSTSVKALLSEFAGEGLRMVEINRQNFPDFYNIMEAIKNRRFRFILFIDDLSFEASDSDYKYIKSCIEGSLENSAENVLIYATSNRRHLIRENWNDRNEGDEQDIHVSETHQEKLSLSDRFGISLSYFAPNKEGYLTIVKTLADQEGITMPEEELRSEAMKWEIANHGFSGRTARQFVNHLCSLKVEN